MEFVWLEKNLCILRGLYFLDRGEGDPGLQPGVGPRRTEGRGPNPVPTFGYPGLQARVDSYLSSIRLEALSLCR
jgi:hypothetical protein